MAITDYTTYSDIRAALGVSEDELKDDTLSLDLYAYNLTAELEDVALDLPTDYATVTALSSRTDAQQRFYESARIFATYALAKQLGAALPMLAPQDIGDGKATISRFSGAPYRDTLALIDSNYEGFRKRLVSAYSTYLGTTVTVKLPSYMGLSSPTSDPVTGS